MRIFIELLPYRIAQALCSRHFLAARVRHIRQKTAPVDTDEAPAMPRRLFIDMTVIANHDAGTGIQRVVREIAFALLREAPDEWDICIVSASKKKPYHRIAWPDRNIFTESNEMRARPGDIFLGLDYALDAVRRHRRQLTHFRKEGGALWFLVHDLLPLHHPDWFSRNTVVRYKAWLNIAAGLADGFFCNSPHTEEELQRALSDIYRLQEGYRTRILPMGHIVCTRESEASSPLFSRLDLSLPFALMVGTLEPRKGHSDILDAFDALWAQGNEQRLILVGRLGWQIEGLRNRILSHPSLGAKLFWFDDIDDAELSLLYEACTGVIIASYGEGFGLPLIEALGHGKPVVARDLPVFRIHQGKGVHFFPADASVNTLADTLEQWLNSAQRGEISVIRPTNDWRTAAAAILEEIAQPLH